MSGRNTRGRDVMGVGLAALNKLAGAGAIDRLRLRKPAEKVVYEASRAGFKTLGAANRAFAAVQQHNEPERPTRTGERGLFDLTPTDEQRMIVEATEDFAVKQLRPAAAAADRDCAAPDTLLKRSVTELGVTLVGVPESLGGMGSQRSTTTGVLVAEALAYGDMGLAVACLAPPAVGNALALWGDAAQQATYLPAFVGDDVPAAALAVLEASMAKAKAGRVGVEITLRCVELAGSFGYSEGSLLEKWARDSKILDIFEGTQQIQQLIVARRLLDKSSSELK